MNNIIIFFLLGFLFNIFLNKKEYLMIGIQSNYNNINYDQHSKFNIKIINKHTDNIHPTPYFIVKLSTPVIRASKGKKIVDFYNLPDYHKWEKTISECI